MKFSLSIFCAATLLAASLPVVALAQEEPDPIAGILENPPAEQPQDAPNPVDPEAESIPTAEPAAPATVPAVEPPVTSAPPSASAPLPPASQPPVPYFTPQVPNSPPPAVGYVAPPVNHAPPSAPVPTLPSAPVPYSAPAAPYAAPYAAPPATYIPPPPPPERPKLTAPVHIDETGKTPDFPPTAVDRSYEARLRASFASAQGLQGPLDGAWTLRNVTGGELYDLALVDNGSALEGAWSDPRRRGAVDSSGFLADFQRVEGGVRMSFYPSPGAGLSVLTLNPAADGAWRGELEERGSRRTVTLKRD